MNTDRPNIVIIYMDDLGWGDLACHGNPYLHTPNLDRLHGQSTRLEHHCSGPVCTPARASLMTGRDAYRTRAIDTYCGRSMMDPGEHTLPEALRAAGYRTCLSGKWHLGDCYPMRPIDKGFEEVLCHNGGGLRQAGNPGHWEGDDSYFNPTLSHNGTSEQREGYCTDIFTDHALNFIEAHQHEPFFVALPTNAPHTPIEVDPAWTKRYTDQGLDDALAGMYAMIENIDMNVGRVMQQLNNLGLSENTILIFSSDHGPQFGGGAPERFNAGLRAHKGTIYQGGLRVPCFWRWPGRFQADRAIERVTHPIDVMPTLLEAAGAPLPSDRTIDGKSLLPMLTGEVAATDTTRYPERYVHLQWHRGDVPVRYRNFAVIGERYKLCQPHDGARPELYDLASDPGEQRDLAGEQPELAEAMRQAYDAWFEEVSATRGQGTYDPPAIHIGTEHETPTLLTRQDWRVAPDSTPWNDDSRAAWWVHLAEAGACRMTVEVLPFDLEAKACVRFGDQTFSAPAPAGCGRVTVPTDALPAGSTELEAWVETADERRAARYLWVERA